MYVAGVDYVAFEEIIMTVSLTFDGARRKRLIAEQPEECFNVTIIGDVFVEFDETFELRLSTDDPDVTLMPNTSVVTIINDDCRWHVVCVCVCVCVCV